jgi:hypothetical protein
MKNPAILVGLGSGREAWVSVDLSSLRFRVETEGEKDRIETITLAELKTRFPKTATAVAAALAQAVKAGDSATPQ